VRLPRETALVLAPDPLKLDQIRPGHFVPDR
jgi:hypothetical protein